MRVTTDVSGALLILLGLLKPDDESIEVVCVFVVFVLLCLFVSSAPKTQHRVNNIFARTVGA